jgi:hypothetical protein
VLEHLDASPHRDRVPHPARDSVRLHRTVTT